MDLTRRDSLAGLGGLAASSTLEATSAPTSQAWTAASPTPLTLPRKADFLIGAGNTNINCAYIHPMSIASAENVQQYARARSRPDGEEWQRIDIKAEFAALIMASQPRSATSRARPRART